MVDCFVSRKYVIVSSRYFSYFRFVLLPSPIISMKTQKYRPNTYSLVNALFMALCVVFL